MTLGRSAMDAERDHEESWYAHVLQKDFFAHEGFRRLVAANLAAFRRRVPVGPGTRLVSLGSGLGDYELALAPSVASIVGYDLSETAVAEATRRARVRNASNVEFVVRAIEEIALRPGSVDVVLAVAVLHHFEDAAARASVLARMHDWLVPGGYLYLWDPSARSLPRRLAAPLLHQDAKYHSPREAPLHPDHTAEEVAAAGFGDVVVDYNGPIGGPLPWVVRTNFGPFWSAVHAFDRAWLAIDALRPLASQFTVTAKRQPDTALSRDASAR